MFYTAIFETRVYRRMLVWLRYLLRYLSFKSKVHCRTWHNMQLKRYSVSRLASRTIQGNANTADSLISRCAASLESSYFHNKNLMSFDSLSRLIRSPGTGIISTCTSPSTPRRSAWWTFTRASFPLRSTALSDTPQFQTIRHIKHFPTYGALPMLPDAASPWMDILISSL